MANLPFPSHAESNFVREEGVHSFALRNEMTVTGLSFSNWDEFQTTLQNLSDTPETVGQLIVSPELITTAGIALETTRQAQEIVEERIEQVTDLSTNFPNSTLLLGSATFSPQYQWPRNSVLYIKEGEQIGQTHKMPYVSAREAATFTQATTFRDSHPLTGQSNVLPLICSDILFHKWGAGVAAQYLPADHGEPQSPLTDEIDTLLVSACWNVPAADRDFVRNDQHYVGQLEFAAQALFNRHQNLQDIVVIDRLPRPPVLATDPQAPINVHYQRKQ